MTVTGNGTARNDRSAGRSVEPRAQTPNRNANAKRNTDNIEHADGADRLARDRTLDFQYFMTFGGRLQPLTSTSGNPQILVMLSQNEARGGT